MLHKIKKKSEIEETKYHISDPVFGSRGLSKAAPKYIMPETEMPSRNAYQLVHDELMLDGNSRLNLVTFVTTWMEPEAEKLMTETFDKNMIDKVPAYSAFFKTCTS